MPYSKNIPLLISIATLLGSMACTRLDNKNMDLQIFCGSEIALDKHFVKVEAKTETFEAIFLNHDRPSPTHLSSKGCIELPETADGQTWLLVRSKNAQLGAVINLLDVGAFPQLTPVYLETNTRLHSQSISISCLMNQSVANKRIYLRRQATESPNLVFNLNLFELTDADGTINATGEISAEGFIPLANGLKEGVYSLRTSSRDAFNLNAPALESECKVVVDRSAPSVRLLSGTDSTALTSPIYVSPGQKISYEVKDTDNASIYACLKQRITEEMPATCEATEFLPMNALVTQNEGVWDLYYYAEDGLGQRSPIDYASFAIFHSDQVSQATTLSRFAIARETLWKQLEAFSALQDAADIFAKLLLTAEKEAVRFPFLSAVWDLDKRLVTVWSRTVSGWDRMLSESAERIIVNSRNRDWMMATSRSKLVAFLDQNQSQVFENAADAEFGPDGSLWVLEQTELALYRKDQAGAYVKGETALSERDSSPFSFSRIQLSKSGDSIALWSSYWIGIYQIKEKKFKIYKIERTPYDREYTLMKEHVAFALSDSQLFYNVGNRVIRIDIKGETSATVVEEPNHCEIQDMAIQKGTLYLASKTRFAPPSGSADADTSCGFQRFLVAEDRSLLAVDFQTNNMNFNEFDRMEFDTDETTILLGKGSQLFIADLRSTELEFETIFLDSISYDERLESVQRLSRKQPKFYVRSDKGGYIVEKKGGTFMAILHRDLPLSDCLAQEASESIVCVNPKTGAVSLLKSDPAARLQPTLSVETPQQAQVTVSPSSGKKVMIEGWNRLCTLLDANNQPLWFEQLPAMPSKANISFQGRFGVVLLETGELLVFDQSGIKARYSPELETTIIEVGISDQGKVFVLSYLDDQRRMDVYTLDGAHLQHAGGSQWTEDAYTYTGMKISPSGEYALTFASWDLSSEPIERVFQLVDDQGHIMKSFTAHNDKIHFTQDELGVYLIRDRTVSLYSIRTGKETEVARDLPFIPHEIIEGNRLIVKTFLSYYDLKSLQKIGQDGMLRVIQGNHLLWLDPHTSEMKVLSPDGNQELASFAGYEGRTYFEVDEIFADPTSGYFHVRISGKNSLLYKTYSLNPDIARTWLNDWVNSYPGK